MASKRPTFPQVKTALDLKYIWYLTKTIRSKVYESVRVCEKRGVCRYGQCYNPICGQISCWKTKKTNGMLENLSFHLIPKNNNNNNNNNIWFRGSPSHVKCAIAPALLLPEIHGRRPSGAQLALVFLGAGNPSKTYWLDRVIKNIKEWLIPCLIPCGQKNRDFQWDFHGLGPWLFWSERPLGFLVASC